MALTHASDAMSAGYSSFSTIRVMNSALNSASTSSTFSASIASGNPFRVPGDVSMLCVRSCATGEACVDRDAAGIQPLGAERAFISRGHAPAGAAARIRAQRVSRESLDTWNARAGAA